MKNRFVVAFALLLISSASYSQKQKPLKLITVSGHVDFKPIYKGGARPSDEMLQQCCTPRPMADTMLFIKKTYYGKLLYNIHTDGLGNFSLKMLPGEYNIYLENETVKAKPERQCEYWLTRVQATLIASSKQNEKKSIVIFEGINPCGPLPQ